MAAEQTKTRPDERELGRFVRVYGLYSAVGEKWGQRAASLSPTTTRAAQRLTSAYVVSPLPVALVHVPHACSSDASLPPDKPALGGRSAWESASKGRGPSFTDVRWVVGLCALMCVPLSLATGGTQQKADECRRLGEESREQQHTPTSDPGADARAPGRV